MKGKSHELFNTIILILLFLTLLYSNVRVYSIILFSIGWVISTFYLSPDLDAGHSRSLKRIGKLKYLFYFTKHRGTLHKPFFWASIFLIFAYFGFGWFGTGLTGAALVHIITDK
jgi:uncharacterized metal-binding protein